MSFVTGMLAAVPEARIGLLGDFNEFGFLEPMQVLTGADESAPVVSDLLDMFDATARYSYVFEGNSQALDHFFVTPALAAGASVQVAHVNAEFADQVSDHDPIVASFDVSEDESQNDDSDTDTNSGNDDETSAQVNNDGSSGGCTLGNGRDAGLPLLLLAALLTLIWRQRRRT